MNRALRRVSLICLVMFVALLVNVNYVQGFEASSLASEPHNGRTFNAQFQFQRGSIITADQKVIAYSTKNKAAGEFQRHYPFGALYAPVTGFDSHLQPDRRGAGRGQAAVREPTPRWRCTTSST